MFTIVGTVLLNEIFVTVVLNTEQKTSGSDDWTVPTNMYLGNHPTDPDLQHWMLVSSALKIRIDRILFQLTNRIRKKPFADHVLR